MSAELVITGMAAFIVVREAYFMWSTQKLINKLMCKNLHEYELAQTVGKPREVFKAVIDEDMAQDLRELNGMF